MKENWKTYFSFSRNERRGVLALLSLIVMIGFLPYLIPAPEIKYNAEETRKWESELAAWRETGAKAHRTDTAIALNPSLRSKPLTGNPHKDPVTCFPFDPNRLEAEGWRKLGIPEKVIQTILNYLGKGGIFRKPEDIGRIYGMRAADMERLLPWVQIRVAQQSAFSSRAIIPKDPGDFINRHRSRKPDSLAAERLTAKYLRKKRYEYIDINAADTSAWMQFPGIGSRLAFRIVTFRDKLGGFASTDQVGETWALPDSSFQKIRPWLKIQSGIYRKIKINTADAGELRQHPYLRWNLANAIVEYRKQHGPFNSVEDLHRILLLTADQITKIAPYIEY